MMTKKMIMAVCLTLFGNIFAANIIFDADFEGSTPVSESVTNNASVENLNNGTAVGEWTFIGTGDPGINRGAIISNPGGTDNSFVFDTLVSGSANNQARGLLTQPVDLGNNEAMTFEFDIYPSRQGVATRQVRLALTAPDNSHAFVLSFELGPVTNAVKGFNWLDTNGSANVIGIQTGISPQNPDVDSYRGWSWAEGKTIHVKIDVLGQTTAAGTTGAMVSIDWDSNGLWDIQNFDIGPRNADISQIDRFDLFYSGSDNRGAYFDNIKAYVIPETKAYDPSVQQEQADQVVLCTFNWKAAPDPDGQLPMNPAVKMQYIYLSQDQLTSTDPNLYYAGQVAVVNYDDPDFSFGPISLNLNGKYYWSVETGLDDGVGGVYPAGHPDNIAGRIWSFETLRTNVPTGHSYVQVQSHFDLTKTGDMDWVTIAWGDRLTGEIGSASLDAKPVEFSRKAGGFGMEWDYALTGQWRVRYPTTNPHNFRWTRSTWSWDAGDGDPVAGPYTLKDFKNGGLYRLHGDPEGTAPSGGFKVEKTFTLTPAAVNSEHVFHAWIYTTSAAAVVVKVAGLDDLLIPASATEGQYSLSFNPEDLTPVEVTFIFTTSDPSGTGVSVVAAAYDGPYPGAYDPSVQQVPTDNEILGTLSWKAGPDPQGQLPMNPAIKTHYVYLSLDQRLSTDPNLYYLGEVSVINYDNPTFSFGPVALNFDGLYFWSVETGMDDGHGGAYPAGDPNNIAGRIWPLETIRRSLDWYLEGTGDKVSLYQETNWLDSLTGNVPPAGVLNGNVPVDRSLNIRAGNPGGSAGETQSLHMGTGALLVSHATLRMSESAQAGINMGTGHTSFDIIDGRVFTEFIHGGEVVMSGRSELTIYSDDPNTMLENTTIELTSPDCYVYLPNVRPASVNGSTFIANDPSTNGNVRITQYYRGSIVRAVPVGGAVLKAFAESDLKGPLDAYSSGFYGNIGVGEAEAHSLTDYTVVGFGNNIGQTSDVFHFVYRTLSGDGEIIASVDSMTGLRPELRTGRLDDNAKAGVMIRETLDHDSRYALSAKLYRGDAFYDVRLEPASGHVRECIAPEDPNEPVYVRLTRSGSSFTAYYSMTGAAGPWTQMGTPRTIDMAQDVYVGLAVTSRQGALLNTVEFSEVAMNIGGVPSGAGAFGLFDAHMDVHPPFADENQIGSFLLKKGYQVTVSQEAAGQGFSQVYIATEKDRLVNLPVQLDNNASWMRVLPWRWIAKKGWGGLRARAVAAGAYWDYRWEPSGNSSTNIEFVPMVKGRAQNQAHRWEEVRTRTAVTHFLGFNEPMAADQGDLTVDEAIALWPRAQQLGLRLGSPARTDGANGDNWLQEFMQKVDENGYRVDYIVVHNYNQFNANNLKNWLQAEYNKYGLPIWLKEFNNGRFANNDQDVVNYLSSVLPMLEDLPFLERYAYFNDGSVSLFESGTNDLNAKGSVYYNQASNPSYISLDDGDWCTVELTVSASGQALTLSADVSLDPDVIASVEYFVNGESVGIADTAPYSINATQLGTGLKTVYARATTTFGEQQSSESSQVMLTDVPGDLTADGKVDMEDMAELSSGWQQEYDMETLILLAENWLRHLN